MVLYILQGTSLLLPYKISYHAENTETYDEYLDTIDKYNIKTLIIESNEFTDLPANILKFRDLERLEIRGAYWCKLTTTHIPPTITFLSLSGIRNINIDFFETISELRQLQVIEILEGHLTMLPDWEATSIEFIIIHLENYCNFLKIRNLPANHDDLWKLIPAMRLDKTRSSIKFEPHYDQSYLGLVIIHREIT